jgi:hypothetical protein
MALGYLERNGEIYVMRHSPRHEWWYFPKMTPEQVILLKTYDSRTDGPQPIPQNILSLPALDVSPRTSCRMLPNQATTT